MSGSQAGHRHVVLAHRLVAQHPRDHFVARESQVQHPRRPALGVRVVVVVAEGLPPGSPRPKRGAKGSVRESHPL